VVKRWIARGLVAVVVAPVTGVAPAFAEVGVHPMATVELAEWGLADHSEIRVGSLSEVRDGSPARLDVRALWRESDLAPETPSAAAVPATSDACFAIEPLRPGAPNALGGSRGVFQRSPSSAAIGFERGADGWRQLAVRCQRETEGFCGVWIQLYDPVAPGRVYLDARPFESLVLWVRGEPAGVQVKLADERLDRLEDSAPVGDLADMIGDGEPVDGWRQATLRLDSLPPALDTGRLASLAFECTAAGSRELTIAGLGLCRAGARLELPAAAPERARVGRAALRKALWVWDTEEILERRTARRKLVDFLARHGFSDVFLQIPREAGAPTVLSADRAVRRRLRHLVADMHRRDVGVHALDGACEYALPARHQEVIQGVRSIAAYNAAVTEEERFDGVHYDIEPYLLPGFGSSRRSQILGWFLTAVDGLAREAHAAGLEVGVDIPFWYDARDEDTGQEMSVRYAGRAANPAEHLLAMVDNMGIMDYRTTVDGADGVLAHAAGELADAAERGTEILVGLETHPLPVERYLKFSGAPARGAPEGLGSDAEVVASLSRQGRASLHLLRVGELDGFLAAAARDGGGTADVLVWPVERSVEVAASRISFASLGPERLDSVMAEAEPWLLDEPAFAGFAIHHYGSYRKLLGE